MIISVILLTMISVLSVREASAGEGPLRAIGTDATAGTSQAIIVPGSTSLAQTTQILPLDSKGKIVGAGQVETQSEAVLDQLAAALRTVDADFAHLARVHVYAAKADVIPAFRAVFARRMTEGKAHPAISFVVGKLANPEALVALDAVAATSRGSATGAVLRLSAEALKGQGRSRGSHLAVLPSGPRLFISGQAEAGPSMAQATRLTLESLLASLRHCGLDRSHIVQLKSFLGPMTTVAEAEREIAAFFGTEPVPPLAFVEWESSLPIEIELVAAATPSKSTESVEYLAPPALKPSPVFSRMARVNHGDLIYIGGLYGPESAGGKEQVEAIFDSLRHLLKESGGDLNHLVKATYYVSDEASSRALNELRPRYYDPTRPPAASKANVPGVGAGRQSVTLDMIAVRSSTDGKAP